MKRDRKEKIMYGIRVNEEIGERERKARREEIADRQKRIITLKQSGYSYTEIADILGLSESHVRRLGK